MVVDGVIIGLPCRQSQLSTIWKVQCDWLSLGKECFFSVEQAFVGREEVRAPLKTLEWEASPTRPELNPINQ